jgi:N-acetylmuramic acid 6-phosphate etherase
MAESDLFRELQSLTTEKRNPRSMRIDAASTEEILRIINDEDARVVPAVRDELPYIAEAVELVVEAFRSGGRLIYAGAGTSGRLGVLDAAECPPTFGSPPDLVQGLIAGGKAAMFVAQEGAEDHESNGREALESLPRSDGELGVTPKDVVCGIAASRRTPFVVGAVKYAREVGCKTLFVTCNPRDQFDLHEHVDVAICAAVGPEVIMGSTRMKSGTAQKLVLNMITTAAFVRMGKVYENMMIDLQMTNEKLKERSKRIVMIATGVDYAEAKRVLDAAGGHVKTALVMILADVDAAAARARLDAADGFVRQAIEN